MKRLTRLASCLLAALTLSPRVGDACGGCFYPTVVGGEKTAQVVTDHRMVLSLSAQQTTLWDQIRYAGQADAFLWVLPIPRGVPVRVGLGDNAFVNALADLSAPRIRGDFAVSCSVNDVATARAVGAPGATAGGRGDAGASWGGSSWGGGAGGCGGSTAPSRVDYTPGSAGSGNGGTSGAEMPFTGTENLSVAGEHDTVGPYATEVVRGGDGSFQRWAAQNRVDIPGETLQAVRWYEDLGTDFLVLRLAPEAGIHQMQPVRISFPGYLPTLPLRMIAAGVADKVGLDLMVLAAGAMQVRGFANEFVDATQIVWDVRARRSNYRALFEGILARHGGRVWVTESTQGVVGEMMSLSPSGPRAVGLDSGIVEVLAGASDAGDPWVDPGRLLQPGRVPMEDPRADPYVDRRIAFAGLGPRPTLTRLRTELNRRALDQDLQLDAAPEGFTVLRDRQAFRATNLPRCVGGTVASPELEAWLSGDAGAFPQFDAGAWNLFGTTRPASACTVSHRRGAGPGMFLFAAAALLARRALRRRPR
ncbi:MAG: DUF2330 domain-containing protein [Polyangiales bacterium]